MTRNSKRRRDSVTLLLTDEERQALRWLGEALQEHYSQRPVREPVDRSLAPGIQAAARDLRALSEFLRAMDPRREPGDDVRAEFAHRAADQLEMVARFLESGGGVGAGPAERPVNLP